MALTLPLFRLALPLACHWLDALDTHRGFTVGYHIATRRADPPAGDFTTRQPAGSAGR